ncbi:MAG TPA: DinB family protein [Gemmatimonadaceae bacterium]|nr:DinB family protein [Gemmatimonadaceae bacterium]
MRRFVLAAAALTLGTHAAAAQAKFPPGARGDFLATFSGVGSKFEQLSTAFPADKYAWSPGKGVRSVCATFTHIAAENYEMGKAFGGPAAPANLAKVDVLTCLGDKATVVAAVKKSFDDILAAVGRMPDADLEGAATLFGVARPRRTWLVDTAEHAGEHLGLLIAYARMNNIVPPWSK